MSALTDESFGKLTKASPEQKRRNLEQAQRILDKAVRQSQPSKPKLIRK